MLFKDINKRFTEVVTEYIAKGYYFNVASMAGHQGEVGKVDLTDGKEIIRILLDSFADHDEYIDGITLIVGRVGVEDMRGTRPNSSTKFDTIWNNHLEIISEEKFYQVGSENRCGSKCYGTPEEARAARKKSMERYRNKNTHYGPEEKVLPEAAKQIVLNFVKRQPRCKSTKLDDIEKVYSVTYRDGLKHYYVEAKGKRFKLG